MSFMLRAALFTARRDFDSAAAVSRALAQRAPDLVWRELAAYSLSQISLVQGKLADAEAYARKAMAVSEQRGLPAAYVGGAIGLATIDVRYRNAPAAGRRKVEQALRRYEEAPPDAPVTL